MPAPTSYTEAALKTFMVDVLSSVAGALALTTSSAAITRAVTSVERVLGVSDTADLTDMTKLETIAAWKAWQAAADTAAINFDASSGGAGGSSSARLSQMFDQINKRLAAAEDAALVYSEVQAASGAGGVAVISSLGGVSNPYGWEACTEFG